MRLSVTVDGHEAKIMRGPVQVGTIHLDGHMQLTEVTVLGTATSSELEMIVRLAASHVAQYNVTGRTRVTSVAAVLVERTRYEPLSSVNKATSLSLLDFDAIPPQHASLSVAQLMEVMRSVGVSIKRR